MDPISLVLLLSAGLGALGVKHQVDEAALAAKMDPMMVRTVWTASKDGQPWELVEILSPGALQVLGEVFDLRIMDWEIGARSGQERIFVLCEVGGDGSKHAVVRAMRAPGGRWVPDVAYGMGGNRVAEAQMALVQESLQSLQGTQAGQGAGGFRAPSEAALPGPSGRPEIPERFEIPEESPAGAVQEEATI